MRMRMFPCGDLRILTRILWRIWHLAVRLSGENHMTPTIAGMRRCSMHLRSCEPIHGGLIDVNPELGHPAGGGWPEFIIWPKFTTLVHQQAYIDWIYRAYQGGLRFITCLAVNNELLAIKTSPNSTHDDKHAIQIQVAAMKAMAEYVNHQAGGPGKGWMQIVYSPGGSPQGDRREQAGGDPGGGS